MEAELSGSDSASRPSSPAFSSSATEIQQKKQKRLLNSLQIRMNEAPATSTSKQEDCNRSYRKRISEAYNIQMRKKPKLDLNYYFPPAKVDTDPLFWSVDDVEKYVLSQPLISHHAVLLREQEVDGKALLLLNLPTLVHYFNLPHSSAVVLAQHICKVKLAHFVHYAI